ncbi:MAG: hypothetical protein GY845_23640 [Planctomycetes bacterium]|nr:hypothetical protein [Planctomycetota bacterium]
MITVKPSDGIQYTRQKVFVEGKISGHKSYSESQGGRWMVRIVDLDSPVGRSDAILVLNENPEQNLPVNDMGVKKPNQAMADLFCKKEFEKLFQPGMTFKAEAIAGDFNGEAWFNVSQILLFDPDFKIGARQLYNEPVCERRLLLRTRGVIGNHIRKYTSLSGSFIGNLVHSTFQGIVTSANRENLIVEFKSDPKKFLLKSIQLEAILIGAIGQLGHTPCISGEEWTTVRNQIKRLIDSQSIQDLLSKETNWFSEVPVSGNAIHGDIDLRSQSKILELKTGIHYPAHDNQLLIYLVGEMLEHGFAIKEHREAYLIYSSGQIHDDNFRIRPVHGDHSRILKTLERFLMARHRLLLVSAGKKLPKVELDPLNCKGDNCEFYLSDRDDGSKSGCHFYCQTDRNWSCKGCSHSAQCTEHSKYHSFEVLDEANHIRSALSREVEFHRKTNQETKLWTGRFKIVDMLMNRVMVLKPLSGYSYDPPSPGEKVVITYEDQCCPSKGTVVGVDDDCNWIVISQGTTSLDADLEVRLTRPRSELNGLYYLQGCLDKLQRLGDISCKEGISFAGGNIMSDQPEITEDLSSAISDNSITDIFCQCFNVLISRKVLQETIGGVKGKILIVTDIPNLSDDDSLDLRGEEILKIASGASSISDALKQVKEELDRHDRWIISPDILLNTDIFNALPDQGHKYFDYIIIYETNSITGLEYFLMRQFGKHMVTVGDANCIGRPLHSQQSTLLGLGDNLMSRVYGRGFPRIENIMIPKMVCLKDQSMDLMLNQGLESCRMVSAETCDSKPNIEIELIPSEIDAQESTEQLVCSHELAISNDGPPKELKLKMNELITEEEMENDLRELEPKINNLLVEGQILTPTTSGRRYVAKHAPVNRDDGGTRWLVYFYTMVGQSGTNATEAEKVIQKVKELKRSGVKPKNLAIMSTSPDQLTLIDQKYGAELVGIALRTPYGIRGESWGNIIVSCATQSVRGIDAREFYTMIRAARTRIFIIGAPSILQHHPLLRNMQKSATGK